MLGVKFPEIAAVVNKDGALERLFREGVVANAVVCEVVEDFKSEEVAGRGDISIPCEDGAIDNLDVVGMSSRRSRSHELGCLERSERRGDLDDSELCTRVDVRLKIADVVQDVEHEGPITCS